MTEDRLAGRVAIVTGGARGIGRAIAERLAAEGAAVAVHYRRHGEEAEAVASGIRASGGRAVAVGGDVSQAAEVLAMVEVARRALGPIDILVNNAAETDRHREWSTVTEAEWDNTLAVNAKGPFLCIRAVVDDLTRSGTGRVINIASVTFHLGQARLLDYVASKGALVGLTRTLARELGPAGVTVNAISPGAIRTDAELEQFPGQDEEVAQRMASRQAIPRRGLPSDIGAAAAFLASDDAGFITGQDLVVDGGWVMT